MIFLKGDILKENITALCGVGQKRAEHFRTLGLFTVSDILRFYPRAYEDRTKIKKIANLTDGETVCIRAKAVSPLKENIVRKNFYICTLKVSDGTAFCELVWFNNRYIKNMIRTDREYVFYGKVTTDRKLQIHTPLFDEIGKNEVTGKIFPVYSLCNGLTSKIVNSTVKDALSRATDFIPETLPEYIRKKYNLCSIDYAIKNIHFPESEIALDIARRRLVFEELFVFQSALFYLRGGLKKEKGIPFKNTEIKDELISSLPFSLTNAQMRVVNEISDDLKKDIPMSRLVQGDVGCGKTMVAAIAMFICAKNGYSSALMAPTEILATQHAESLSKLFKPFGINVSLITGSMKAKERRLALESIKSGETKIIVGTHALISEKTELGNLGLIITDEQHRFGVMQRKKLEDKGVNPHTLVMTATPIPRTLALMLYGDLDISVIDELPPGRKAVDTFIVGENMRERIYAFLKKEADAGRQSYVVCPAVESSEILDIKDVYSVFDELSSRFGKENVSFIHGKMKPAEKDEIMLRFKNGESKILVSTTVIEVGVDVPNASVIVVEDAARFGLSQLHQLRGRVGRGSLKSYCILFPGKTTPEDIPRMTAMKKFSDGFKIAEEDLKLRGPGEFFGARQHGLMTFKIANLYCDTDILKETTKAAKDLIKNDIKLEKCENKPIFDEISRLFDTNITFS